MLTQNERVRFRSWLKRKTDLSDKVVSDTASRLARIATIAPLHTDVPVDEFLFRLGKNKKFCALGVEVRSQLRRAYALYHSSRNDC